MNEETRKKLEKCIEALEKSGNVVLTAYIVDELEEHIAQNMLF